MDQDQIPQGRRSGARLRLGFPAKVDLISGLRDCQLVDISNTGARVYLTNPPKPGACGSLLVENLDLFGTVIWNNDDFCGLCFDEPLGDDQVLRLRDQTQAILAREQEQRRHFARSWVEGR